MGFGQSVEIKKLPNKEDILSCITDEQIFVHFLGGIPKKPICSPLREDKVPSFNVFYSDNYQKLMYKDFATGDRGDAFVFVMKLFNFSRITDVFCFLAEEFQLNQFETKSVVATAPRTTYVSKNNIGKVVKDRITIKIKVREWNLADKKFWSDKYGFSKKQLEYCGVFPISHYFINDYVKKTSGQSYAYLEQKDGIKTWKIYQPFGDNKWINNNDFSTWEMWNQLPTTGENLVISSSRKDSMTVLFTLGRPSVLASCALQSENTNAKESVINELKSRFKDIYVLYDNDFDNINNPGRTAGKKMCDKFNLTQIEIPEKYGVKDPSDFREKYGQQRTNDLIKKLIKDEKNN